MQSFIKSNYREIYGTNIENTAGCILFIKTPDNVIHLKLIKRLPMRTP